MTDLDKFRENWKVELGLKENEKLNQGEFFIIICTKSPWAAQVGPGNFEFVEMKSKCPDF